MILGGFLLAMVVTATLLMFRPETSTGEAMSWCFLWPVGPFLGVAAFLVPPSLLVCDVILARESPRRPTASGTVVFSTNTPPRGVFPIRCRFTVDKACEGAYITWNSRRVGPSADPVARYPLGAPVTVYYTPATRPMACWFQAISRSMSPGRRCLWSSWSCSVMETRRSTMPGASGIGTWMPCLVLGDRRLDAT